MALPVPQSFEDLERLVKQLYEPNPATLVSKIEKTLQKWQRCDAGWEVAERLLQSDEANVRFFGALTLTVKLNVDWEKINTEDAPTSDALLSGLVTCLIQFVNPSGRNEPAFVVKKMCSTLVTYYCKPVADWSASVRQLACSLSENRFVPESMSCQISDFSQIALRLSPSQLRCVLWFAKDLADEVGNLDPAKYPKFHERMKLNIADVKVLMKCSLRLGESSQPSITSGEALGAQGVPPLNEKLVQDGLLCFVSWSTYFQRDSVVSPEVVQPLLDLIPDALTTITLDVEDAETILVDWLDSSASLLRSQFAQNAKDNFYFLFTSPWSQRRVVELQQNDPSSTSFAKFLVAFSEIEMNNLVREPTSTRSRSLLDLLHLLLQCPGAPGDEDEVALIGMEFWSTFIESIELIDSGSSWVPLALQETRQAIQELFVKVRYPSLEAIRSWNSETKQAFQSFRSDFQDILQSAYVFLGSDLTQSLTETTSHQLSQKDWWSVEASLFCLNALADPISENVITDSPEDLLLLSLFNSSLFSDLSADQSIPARARRAAIELLGQFSSIFERRVALLPSALNFLFSSLPVANLTMGAARSICTLCSSCRKHLLGELPAFIQHYHSFRYTPTADISTKEKVVEGISSVVQALQDVEEQKSYITTLLRFVEDDVRAMLEHVAANEIEEGQVRGQSALASLASMGRGLQAPDDAFIGVTLNRSEFQHWVFHQEVILRCIDATTQVLDKDAELIEQACHVLRAGYKEKLPGPFVLPARATTDFVSRTSLETPRLPYVLSTAVIFLKCHIDRLEPNFEADSYPLLAHVLAIMKQLDQPEEDPEVAQGCIDVLSTFLSGELANVVFNPEIDTQFGIEFVQRALRGSDVLPKRAACSFWNSLLSSLTEAKPGTQSIAKEAMDHYGPSLCDILLEQICGGAPQSALEYLHTPFVKLIATQPNARKLVELSLNKVVGDVGGDMGSAKARFYRAIMGARGATARKIMTEFWSACRQYSLTSSGYGSAANPQLIE